MKVVINKCYGGFGISVEALKELVMRNADCIESYTPKIYYGGENPSFANRDWVPKWEKDFTERFVDVGDGYMGDKVFAHNIYKDGLLYSLKSRGDNQTRIDKDLIEVVEKMGKMASGKFAELRIVEIPDDIQWEIDEYDGIESIHEQHRSW